MSDATLPALSLGATPLQARARQSLGVSHDAIYRMVAAAMTERRLSNVRLIDVGCGAGRLLDVIRTHVASYCGLDAVRYGEFPPDAEFHAVDLDGSHWPVPERSGDVVTAVEVIEHLENPWAFMRQLACVVKDGGWVLVTTPNQLSLLSRLSLITKRRFSAFHDAHYPAHRTALLESDLWRAAAAAGLAPVAIAYSHLGRVPGSAWHYPRRLAQAFPRLLSDNLMLVARRVDG